MSVSILSTIVGAVLNRSDKSPIIIAIDGPCTSGKSAFARDIAKNYDCNVFHMDDFFLTPERKTDERLAIPGGNVDWEGFCLGLKDIGYTGDFVYEAHKAHEPFDDAVVPYSAKLLYQIARGMCDKYGL